VGGEAADGGGGVSGISFLLGNYSPILGRIDWEDLTGHLRKTQLIPVRSWKSAICKILFGLDV
jgi:hypothetical protein